MPNCYEVCICTQIHPDKNFLAEYFVSIRKPDYPVDFTEGELSFSMEGKFDYENHYIFHRLEDAIKYAVSFKCPVKFTNYGPSDLLEFTPQEIKLLHLYRCRKQYMKRR